MRDFTDGERTRRLLEAAKPRMVANIERCFGNLIWEQGPNYELSERDLCLMFDIINDGLFGGRLDRGVGKVVLREDLISTGPRKYRGMEHALAAYAQGKVQGTPSEIIMVKHLKKDNFFVVFSALIHEMIHMHDHHFGPMSQQLRRFGAIGGYNLNCPLPGLPPPRTPKDLVMANLANAAAAGLHPMQLPDEIQRKIENPMSDVRPRQYGFPAEPTTAVDKETGERLPAARPLPKKYEMSPLTGFYDVHGAYFMSFAEKANAMGFSVKDVFTGSSDETAMRKVFEKDGPANVAEAICGSLRSKDPVSAVYVDDDNWYVEIW